MPGGPVLQELKLTTTERESRDCAPAARDRADGFSSCGWMACSVSRGQRIVADLGGAHLAFLLNATALHRDLQALHRYPVYREDAGHRRSLSESADQILESPNRFCLRTSNSEY